MKSGFLLRLSPGQAIRFASFMIFATVSPLAAEEDGWIIPSAGLNLREAPDAAGKRITTIPFNEKVQVIDKSGKTVKLGGVEGEWLKIRWNGKEGWGFGPYVSGKPFQTLPPDNFAAQFKGGCLAIPGTTMGQCMNMCGAGSIIFEANGGYAENPSAGPGCAYDSRPGKWILEGKKITVTGEEISECCAASEQTLCKKGGFDGASMQAEACAICMEKKVCPAGMTPEAYAQKHKKQWKLEYLIEKDGTFSLKKKNHGRMYPLESQN